MPSFTPKRERFAQEVASGKNQSEAYRLAFNAGRMMPKTVQEAASRLMADGKVAARVAALRRPIAEKAQITLESHLRDLQDLRDIAVRKGQLAAAIAAEIARGKAAGVHVERTASTLSFEHDDDTRAEAVAQRLERLAAGPTGDDAAR